MSVRPVGLVLVSPTSVAAGRGGFREQVMGGERGVWRVGFVLVSKCLGAHRESSGAGVI